MQSTINDDDDVIYDYDLTITLPHDNLFSPCFFESFSNAVPAGIDYLRLGRSRHLIRECTRELEDILEKKVRVRLVPTFGMKVASFVDKSKHVCFDFDYDTVLLSLDDDEPDVDDPIYIANALRAIGTYAPNLLHAVDKVVNLPVVLSAEEYTEAVTETFERTVDRFSSSARFNEHPATIALVAQCLYGVRDSCHKSIHSVSILDSARTAYLDARSMKGRLDEQFGRYTKQVFPFNGLVFVRQDKIPDQLKLCSVRVLRRRMVRYLSDTTNFTRFDEADDSVLASLSDFIFTFLRHCDHTVGESTWTAWMFDLLARVLDRDKPKGGSRPVCNNQTVITTLLDKLCACLTTACLALISAHVRSCQTDIGSKLGINLHMIWSIGNIQHFIDMIPTQPIGDIQHCSSILTPTSTFSDVSGCFNNVPQGYPRPYNDAPTIQTASLTASIQEYCDGSCRTAPADGSETLEMLCDDGGVSFDDATIAELSCLLDGWHSDIFLNRDKLDIRMFQDAMVTKAFLCQARAADIDFDDVVLQIRITDTGVRTIGWDSKKRVKRSVSCSMVSSIFLDHCSAKQILAVLVMSQTLRAGNAVVLSLLGVMQGSYSGAQSIDGILTISEIGFNISLLVSKYRWVLAHYQLTTRYVDDSAFLTNPFARWLLPLTYPVHGLKFTTEVIEADGVVREYLGIHVSMVRAPGGWYTMHTAWYAKKHSIPRKYNLSFTLKPSFHAHDRPRLSSRGLIAGDVFRMTQACSDSDVFFVSLQQRFAYWTDEVLMSIKYAVNQLVDTLARHMRWLILRFNWHDEPAALAAADTFFTRLMLFVHPMVGLVTDSVYTATQGYNKLIASLLQHHGLQRCQYQQASPDFALEFRSPFSAYCRTVRSMFERHLLSTADSDLDAEHPDYTAQKRSLEKARSGPSLSLRPPVYPPLATSWVSRATKGLMHKSLKRPRSDSAFLLSLDVAADEACD